MKQYGFWKHDHFPFVLSSPGEMQDDGWFKADKYDGGLFRPIKVLPMEEGIKMATGLQALAGEYDVVLRSLHRGFIARVIALAPWAVTAPESTPTKARKPVAGRRPAAG